MRAIKQVLDARGQVLRKGLLDPLKLHSAGQPEQGQVLRTARRYFPNCGRHEQLRILNHALAHQGAAATFGQLALQGPLVAADAKLVNKTRHDAPQQRIIRMRNADCGMRNLVGSSRA